MPQLGTCPSTRILVRCTSATDQAAASVPLPRASESYVTELVFDLPADIREPRLYVGSAGAEVFFLIGHEESPLHKKIWFRI